MRFFNFFQHEITELQGQIDRLADLPTIGGERSDAAEHCLAAISRLSTEVKEASSYLPPYDQRTYSAAIKALQEKLQETKATFAPKPKFSFKAARKSPSAISLSDAATTILLSTHQLRIHNSSNLHIYLHSTSRPIIENSTGIVDDFQWIKATPSPNWRIDLSRDLDRRGDIWPRILDGGTGGTWSVDEILAAVGVGE
ncbi:hypothetical protein DV738_g1443, partial [Chaetothyriales sp. CBS 135597]